MSVLKSMHLMGRVYPGHCVSTGEGQGSPTLSIHVRSLREREGMSGRTILSSDLHDAEKPFDAPKPLCSHLYNGGVC